MILYPTETIYGLGVNALIEAEIAKLFQLKGRDQGKVSSWLVRTIADIEQYAQVSELAAKIAEQFLPGQLTLILPAKSTVPARRAAPDHTIGLRISADPIAQKLVADFMNEHNAPLTCTSANVSGKLPLATVPGILAQFGSKSAMIDTVIDDGPRMGMPSTVVKIVDDTITILREGSISSDVIYDCAAK